MIIHKMEKLTFSVYSIKHSPKLFSMWVSGTFKGYNSNFSSKQVLTLYK
jgi:hypothetical protein